jgi:ATP-dependent Clp protease protease subunit
MTISFGPPPGPGLPAGPPGADWSTWLRSQLFERRIVLLRGPLDDELAGHAAAELMMLDATGDEPVALHVDSGGGPLHAALSVMDTIDLLGVPVTVTCVGRAEGSAVGVVAAAERRFAAPHARFHLAEPSSSVTGSAADLHHWAQHHQVQLERFVERMAQATGRNGEHIEADMAAGRWLSAEEAVEYGLVDQIWQSGRDRRVDPRPRPPLGFGRPPW